MNDARSSARYLLRMGLSTETASVTVAVTSIVPTSGGGRVMALATVDITIEGVEFRVMGLRLVKRLGGSVIVELPMIRDALGRSTPCIAFPDEIHRAIELAITREVVETVQDRSRSTQIRPD